MTGHLAVVWVTWLVLARLLAIVVAVAVAMAVATPEPGGPYLSDWEDAQP